MSSSRFDGEASETDDESINETPIEPKNVATRAEDNNPVNKLLVNKWSQMATNVIRYDEKRMNNVKKTMNKILESSTIQFEGLQKTTTSLNAINRNVVQLEDSMADLIDALKAIPDNIQIKPLNIPKIN